jgi:hypothetical protein
MQDSHRQARQSMSKPAIPPSQQPFILGKYQGLAVLAIFMSYAVEAPLRFGLMTLHAGPLIYLREVVSAMVVAGALFHWVNGKKQNPSTLVALFLVAHVFVGIITLGSIVSPILSYKSFLPLLLGVACYDTLRENEKAFFYASAWAFVITCIGIGINWATEMPWSGAVFESAAGDIALSREWTAGGIRRLAGFARASFDASTMIAITCLPLLTRVNASFISRLLVNVIALVAIFLTTTKGSILAMFVIAIFTLFFIKTQKPNKLNPLFFTFPVVGLAIPFLLHAYDFRMQIDSGLWVLFSSFADRVNNTWPAAFNLFKVSGNIFTGRGMGGIGFPQLFGDPTHYNPADNVMIYLYVSLGIPAIIYLYYILFQLKKRAASTPPLIWNSLLGWTIYWNLDGLTTNIIENPFLMSFIGLIIGAALSTLPTRHPPEAKSAAI